MSTTAATAERSQPLPPNADAVESIYSKVSWRIIPLLLIAYMIAYLDRINIGYAQLQMKQTLPFGDAVYGIGAGIFFLGYFLFEVPSNLLLERIGARKTLLRIMVLWGLDRGGDDVRDDADAVLYCALPARRIRGGLLSRRHPLFHLLVSVGPPRAGHCDLHVRDHDHQRDRRAALRRDPQIFRRRQWLGRVAMAVPGAGSAGRGTGRHHLFLSAGQAGRCKLADAGREEPAPAQSGARRKGYRRRNRRQPSARCSAIRRSICSSLVYFLLLGATYTMVFWLPTLIQSWGVKDLLLIGIYAAIPNAVGVIGMILIGRSSDKQHERRWHFAACVAVAAIGLVDHHAAAGKPGRIDRWRLSFAVIGIAAATPLFFTLITEYLSVAAAAARHRADQQPGQSRPGGQSVDQRADHAVDRQHRLQHVPGDGDVCAGRAHSSGHGQGREGREPWRSRNARAFELEHYRF